MKKDQHNNMMSTVILILVIMFTTISAEPGEPDQEPVTVHLEDWSDRSANNIQETLTLNVRTKSRGNVMLSLRQNHDVNTNVPITVERDGTILRQHVDDKNDTTFYQSMSPFASIMITKSTANKTEVVGHVEIGNDTFHLQFDDEHHSYTIRKLKRGPRCGRRHQSYTDFPDSNVSGRIQGKISERNRREADDVYEIEVLAVVDYSLYQHWLTKASERGAVTLIHKDQEAKRLIRQYYAFIINGVDLRYRDVETVTVRVLLTGIHVADKVVYSSWTELRKINIKPISVDGEDVLNDFTKWCKKLDSLLPEHDHAMLFTRYDLTRSDDKGLHRNLIGIAHISTLCTGKKQSLVEDAFDQEVEWTSAHELGHSFGAKHDGENNECEGSDGYIMAPTSTNFQIPVNESKRNWIFSRCSQESFKDYIQHHLPRDNCLLRRSNANNIYDDFADQLLGQIYGPDEQCKEHIGEGSYLLRREYGGNYTGICTKLYCENPYTNTYDISAPFDGTSCSGNRVCHSGRCVHDGRLKIEKPEDCLFGDAPRYYWNSSLSCADMKKRNPLYCSYFWNSCCETCSNKVPQIGECIKSCDGVQDGDYKSCIGCNVYASCSGDELYDNRRCPGTLQWDDNLKRCDYSSTTC